MGLTFNFDFYLLQSDFLLFVCMFPRGLITRYWYCSFYSAGSPEKLLVICFYSQVRNTKS